MSDDVEEITKTPVKESVKTKEKDPKKVAAGKKLAEYNKGAKEALKEKIKRDAEKEEERETGESQSKGGWIPEISFTTAISLVGISLTAINMFMSYKKDTKVDPPRGGLPESNRDLSLDRTLREIASRVEPSPPIREPCSAIASKIPVPKMGMH